MKYIFFLVLMFVSINNGLFYAQAESRRPGGVNNTKSGSEITGSVADMQTGEPVEYASVVLFSAKNNRQVTGTVTEKNGRFLIPGVAQGDYYLTVSFMGYKKKNTDRFTLNSESDRLDLGRIIIEQKAVSLDNVVVEGQRVPFTYQVDKKVISVDKMNTAASGTAAEVLENVPSVTVDIDGNVSLRGSGNFTVLVDGRPTILESQEALQQIPASSIENIEIITNPSAKFDPEGGAGIINVVLKKNKNVGISGLSNLNAGLNDKYGGDVLLEYKGPVVTAVLGGDYSRRSFTATGSEERIFSYQGSNSYVNTSGDSRRSRDSYGIRGNLSFILGSSDVLGIGARFGSREGGHNSVSNYVEYSDLNPLNVLSKNKSSFDRSGDFASMNLNYQHKFETKGHEFTADFNFGHDNGDELSISEKITGNVITDGRKTTESGPSDEFEMKLGYVLPFSETNKLEAGAEGQSEYSEENTGLFEYDPLINGYRELSQFSGLIKSREDAYSLYSVYSGMAGSFGYQAGFRGEYTYRNVELPLSGNTFNIDRWDFFPTLHLSYKLNSGDQLMASYTKRIQRARGWQLEPFEVWTDASNKRRGNPALLPELVDSYEAGYQTMLGKVSFSSEVYYRMSNNKIEGIRSVDTSNVTLQSFANVGKDYSLGTEIMASTDLFKFWSVDLMGNIYDYRIEGSMLGKDFSKHSFNWRARLNNVFKLPEEFSLQVNTEYNSPSVSSQTKTEGFVATDLALRKDFMERKLSLTLQVRDIFGTAKMESTTTGAGLYTYSNMRRESPMVMLNLRYSLNNFKQDKSRRPQGDDFGGDEY